MQIDSDVGSDRLGRSEETLPCCWIRCTAPISGTGYVVFASERLRIRALPKPESDHISVMGLLREGLGLGHARQHGPCEAKDFPAHATPQGASDNLINALTLLANQQNDGYREGVRRTFIDTSKVEEQRWGPPLVDADWHALCQAICEGIEGKEWEAMYPHFQDLHQAVKTKKPGENKKARALWAMKEVKDRKEEYCNPNHQNVFKRGPTPLELVVSSP